MTQDPSLITTQDAVKVISITDEPINRMSLAFMDMLEQEVASIAQDQSIRAAVLTAEGDKNFSVGMDLKQLPVGIEQMGSSEAVFAQRLRAIRAIETMGKPWVATLFCSVA